MSGWAKIKTAARYSGVSEANIAEMAKGWPATLQSSERYDFNQA